MITSDKAVELCDRNFGIGGDGVRIANLAEIAMSSQASLEMRISLGAVTIFLPFLARSSLHSLRRMVRQTTPCEYSIVMGVSLRCVEMA